DRRRARRPGLVAARDRDACGGDGRQRPARVPALLARGRAVLRSDPPPLARGGGARSALIAVGLACLSALLFGAMSVGLRIGLTRHRDADLATLATVAGALAVGLVAA